MSAWGRAWGAAWGSAWGAIIGGGGPRRREIVRLRSIVASTVNLKSHIGN